LARARRKKSKGRAARFLLLAGLALLIAGFVARHEIPFLIKHDGHSPAAAAHADIEGGQGLAGSIEKLHPPIDRHLYAGGGEGSANGKWLSSPGAKGSHDATRDDRLGEHISNPERRQLNDLIEEKSR
jgi:hypothetical protein